MVVVLGACKRRRDRSLDDDDADAGAPAITAASADTATAAAVSAAANPAWVEVLWPSGTTRKWSGTWDSGRGIVFSFVMELARAPSGVDGVINWKLEKVPPGHPLAPQIGNQGKEWVGGTVDPVTGALDIRGHKVEPTTLLAADSYALVISRDGNVNGRTESHGEKWKATFSGRILPR